MAQRATSLGPKPSLFVFFFWGGVLVFFFALLSLFFNRQKTCFPPRTGHFLFVFNVSLSFSLNLFWPPPFSVSLSLSLCCSFLFTFLLVFLFCFLFVSCFCLFLSLSFFIAFVSWKEKHENIQLQFVFLKYFLFLLVSCLAFLFQIPFSYLCFFLILSYVFSSTSMFLVSKRTNWEAQKNKKKKTNCNKTGFFMNLCFAKCEKLSFFFCPFFLPMMFKKHYTNRYFSIFLKAKNWKKKMHFEVLLSGPSRCYYLGQVDCILKMTNLAQIITPQICARNFFFKTESVETPIFIVFFWQTVFCKKQTWPR